MDHDPLPRRRSSYAAERGTHFAHQGLAESLGWFSIGLGLAELVASHGLCRALGLRGQEALVQAYGAREIATGAGILLSRDPTPWVWGRVAGDALDLLTLAAGFRDDNPRKTNLGIAIAAVAGVTVLDIICAEGLTAERRS